MSVIITEKETIGFEESEKTFVVYEVAGRGQKGDKGDAGVAEGADFVSLNPALLADPLYQEGRFFYDSVKKTISMYSDIEGVSLQIGQEQWSRVTNKSGALIPDGSVCYVSGAVGQTPTVELALANNFNTSKIIGVATHDIPDNSVGIVTTFGLVHEYDTTGDTVSEVWLEGDLLWVSSANNGQMTKVAPEAPNLKIPIAVVLYSHKTQGILLVRAHFPTNLAAGSIDGQIQFSNTGVMDVSTNFKFNKSTRLLDVTGFIRGTNSANKYTDLGIADPTNHTLYWTNGRLQKLTANADVELAFGGWPEAGWEGKIDVELIVGVAVNITFHGSVTNPSAVSLVEGYNKFFVSTNDSGATVRLTPESTPSAGGGDATVSGQLIDGGVGTVGKAYYLTNIDDAWSPSDDADETTISGQIGICSSINTIMFAGLITIVDHGLGDNSLPLYINSAGVISTTPPSVADRFLKRVGFIEDSNHIRVNIDESYHELGSVAIAPTKATEAEAIAGTNDTKWMTPLKVFQAIVAKGVTIFQAIFNTLDHLTITGPTTFNATTASTHVGTFSASFTGTLQGFTASRKSMLLHLVVSGGLTPTILLDGYTINYMTTLNLTEMADGTYQIVINNPKTDTNAYVYVKVAP